MAAAVRTPRSSMFLVVAALAVGCGALLPSGATPSTPTPSTPTVMDAEGDAWSVAAPALAGFDRDWAQARTREHVQALVALDTQNPPGRELITARYLDQVLSGLPGVTTHVLDVGDGRANFVARLSAGRATATGLPVDRPVLVLGHMDVVGADDEAWDTPPFEATAVDGYLYGRGVMDDKGMLAATTTAFEYLSGRRDDLRRDVVLLATAAEEGGPSVGIELVLEHHAELLGEPAFALNEGGRIRVRDGVIRSVNIQTVEKVYYNVSVTAVGPSGHGSVPLPDNALAVLARATARLHEWRAPVRLNETTRLYFERLATIEADAGLRWAMERIESDDPADREQAIDRLSEEPTYSAVMRTGQSLTMIDGGFRKNVIPSAGTANFNVRILPDDDIDEIVAAMQTVAAEDSVIVALDGERRTSPPPSSVDTELYHAMERSAAVMAPQALVIPFMSTGATDGAALRAIGVPTYGILPMPMVREDELRMHADNERVPLPALGWAAEYITRVLLDVAR